MFKASFNFSGVSVKSFHAPTIRAWLKRAVLDLKISEAELCFVFISDDHLADMNKKYLNHDTLTDIITFNWNEGNSLKGEMYISVDRVAENANKYGADLETELRRVMIHGVLHLAGFNDKTKKDKAKMRRAEDKYLMI